MLRYLLFDPTEDEHGHVNWDAMASVTAARVPALQAEVEQVLRWACTAFAGRYGPLDEGGDWDVDLQAQDDDGQPLPLTWQPDTGEVHLTAADHGRTTLTLSLSGNAQFAQAFEARWLAEPGA